MTRSRVVFGVVLGMLVWGHAGYAAQMLTFRGLLQDADGNPVTSPSELVFRIYDAPTGGRLLAGPFHSASIAPTDGVFSTTFGPVSLDQLGGRKSWLEISSGTSIQPRVEMDPVYYDGIDESGALVGGRTLLPLSLPAPGASPKRVSSRVTTILDNGPSSNRIDLVFVGDGYVETELGLYAVHVRDVLHYILSVPPFSTYGTFFNAHRVDVVSNESGVDNDPGLGLSRDTALDMGFWCGGIERLLCVNVFKASQAAAAAPEVDHVCAVANSVKYGGAGYPFNDLATVAGGNGAALEIAVHETGHSIGNLADEYDSGGPFTYTGPEPVEPNVSTLPMDAMASSGSKWARWLGDPGVGFGGLVSTYEGAYSSLQGIYRPTFDSKMRTLGPPFNLPSVESLILEFYKIVHPIDNATAPQTPLDQFSTVFVDPVDPPGNPLQLQWYLDGNPVEGATQETLRVADGGFALGSHVLSVTARDSTSLVRNESARDAWLTESRSWDLNIGDRSSKNLESSLSPNPWNASAAITFRTAAEGSVKVSIFDLLGRRVRTLLPETRLPPGYHRLALDAVTDASTRLPSGIYFYRIETNDAVATGRFAIAR